MALQRFPATASYRCFNCGAIVNGDDTRWLCDDRNRGYPFCSQRCIVQPWPLREAYDGQPLRLWSDAALVVTMDPS